MRLSSRLRYARRRQMPQARGGVVLAHSQRHRPQPQQRLQPPGLLAGVQYPLPPHASTTTSRAGVPVHRPARPRRRRRRHLRLPRHQRLLHLTRRHFVLRPRRTRIPQEARRRGSRRPASQITVRP